VVRHGGELAERVAVRGRAAKPHGRQVEGRRGSMRAKWGRGRGDKWRALRVRYAREMRVIQRQQKVRQGTARGERQQKGAA